MRRKKRPARHRRRGDLRAAFVTGLVSSTVSTLFVAFGSRQAGRDPKVDFMVVGMVPMRHRALAARPTWRQWLPGVLVHQFADLFWAMVFFRLVLPRLGPRPRRALLASAVPWAVGTAAAEYYTVLPWLQPWLRMQTPFWTASTVHLASAATYPVYGALRGRPEDVEPADRWLALGTGVTLASTLSGLAAATLLARLGLDRRWKGVGDDSYERSFLYRMAGHHEAGLRMARTAARHGSTEELRALARLMVAEHEAELRVMRDWWRGWFGGRIPALTPEDWGQMKGMPPEHQVEELHLLRGRQFDHRFVDLMVPHHEGAILMSDEAWEEARDPRVRLFADSIRHTQRGQIERMEAQR